MFQKEPLFVTEERLYGGFDFVSRPLLKFWKNRTVEIGDYSTTMTTIASINERLKSSNILIFFDHHYAFDAVPVALILGQLLTQVQQVLIPYAAHLDMGVNQNGNHSVRYRIRTRAFHWLIGNIQKNNPNMQVLPVVREFERNNPKLRAIADQRSPGANTRYLKLFTQLFSEQKAGLVCILSPMAGLALPGKPMLHAQIYRLMELVQRRQSEPLPCYVVSAYPRLSAHYHYLAPLLTKHTFVAQGPFTLPAKNHEVAESIVAERIHQLREAVQFTSLDYSRITHK